VRRQLGGVKPQPPPEGHFPQAPSRQAQNTLVQVLLPGTINGPDQWAERTRRIEEVRRQPLIEHESKPDGEAIQ